MAVAAEKNFEGIFVPMVSPCDEAERFAVDAFDKMLDGLLNAPIDGLYLCGGTGDAEKLTAQERMQVAASAVPALKKAGKKAIVHVGQANLRTAVSLGEQAAAAGADGLAAIPPRAGWAGAKEYYQQLAQIGLPVFIYYIPGVTGMSGSFEDLWPILSMENVAGIKISDWNIFLISQIKKQAPEKVVFNGFDEMLLPGLLYGADGSIGTWGNLFPNLYAAIFKLVRGGAAEKALPLHQAFNRFLAEGWEYGILPFFEALMKEKGVEKCFRRPKSWPNAEFKQGFIAAQLDKINEMEQAAAGLA